jgi:hypothetical protein
MMKSKGFVGTLGVHMNLASSGCVHNTSSVRVVLLTTGLQRGMATEGWPDFQLLCLAHKDWVGSFLSMCLHIVEFCWPSVYLLVNTVKRRFE